MLVLPYLFYIARRVDISRVGNLRKGPYFARKKIRL